MKVESGNVSIHPRVVNGRTAHPKVNTAHRSSGAHLRKAIAGTKVHLAKHPNDAAAARQVATFESRLSGNPHDHARG